ncbi:DUF3592 domain-containing protein [Pectobacterium parmentieri]|uniref:DUF3592 domain-containing protein n=1 Tax=Pectobacterium parmentieri TaxID=1905730 RepID=UPI000CDCF029|nr:DUF3592 domain-containing protein [Pectobacterium parmentieri]AYH05521.1 DUF3592 domain-containing protein [Pectobacterium parmentieri]AYH14342.1 DUF3592 domain-containing protein [Pectobacterium parmentieri]AYH23044.1 DUF3592 domain-containing protein [Pectobacterium parmentieri]MBN3178315.1 DUF3592 domain-containing protein [Pectobacterium parmentieri]POW27485.1 hypothetical protein PB20LOC_02130 [Pectobacterium parmentieri]
MSNTFIFIMIVIGIVFGIIPFARFIHTDLYPYIKSGNSQQNALKNGIMADANIISSIQTSAWSGNMPIYKITLKFMTSDNENIETSIMTALSFKEIERLKEGNMVTIKYDPKNPRKIAIYDKPLILGE